MIKLSNRLMAIATWIPFGSSVIDVGTDHGMIPVWLAQNKLAVQIAASDVNLEPLQRAITLAEQTDTTHKIRFEVCDGLSAFSASDANCVVIAGMGGELMIHILSGAPWTRNDVTLILQPQTKTDVLRAWLMKNGYIIEKEKLVKDAGRIYPVLSVRGGEPASCTSVELLLGRRELIANDPLLPEYLELLIYRYEKAALHNSEAEKLFMAMKEWKECIP